MFEYGKKLEARDIPFDHEDNNVLCFPHTINICCDHLIKEFTDVDLANEDEDTLALLANIPEAPHGQTFEDAVQRDPIALGRNIVRVIRSSGQRRDRFEEVIRDGNEKGWFMAGQPPEVVKLPHLQLLRDVKTRWDSVFQMIRRLRLLQPVSHSVYREVLIQCFYFQAIDHFFAMPINKDIAKHKLTEMEWEVLAGMEVVLMVSVKLAYLGALSDHNGRFLTAFRWLCQVNPIQSFQEQFLPLRCS
jgi:hypothetical protein